MGHDAGVCVELLGSSGTFRRWAMVGTYAEHGESGQATESVLRSGMSEDDRHDGMDHLRPGQRVSVEAIIAFLVVIAALVALFVFAMSQID